MAWTAALVATVAVGAAVVVPAVDGPGTSPLEAPRAEASDAAATLVGMINASRQRQGLRSLSVAGDLTAVAAVRARAIADAKALSHTPNLGDAVCCWTWVAENVGYAYSVQQTHDMFMASAPHRANILEPAATDVGIAVVERNGTLWVAEVFRARAGSDASRSSSASQPSRSQDRSTPSGTTDATTSTTTAAGPSAPVRTAPRWTLSRQLHALQVRMRESVEQHGRLDPLRAAVRYSDTLDRVNR